jgi:7-cyano-7-deazaguanine synthase
MSKVVAIVSGGLDSVTLLHYIYEKEQKEAAVLTFLYGQKHQKEIECARYHARLLACPDHQVIDLSYLIPLFSHSALIAGKVQVPDVETIMGDPQPPTYVPNRNMIFLAIAAAYAENNGIGEIYYGAQRHDAFGYWDTTPQFVERLNAIFGLNRKSMIEIIAPFVQNTKVDTLRLGLEIGVDYSQTWSCYEGNELACGICAACAERVRAFRELGLNDPLPYAE